MRRTLLRSRLISRRINSILNVHPNEQSVVHSSSGTAAKSSVSPKGIESKTTRLSNMYAQQQSTYATNSIQSCREIGIRLKQRIAKMRLPSATRPTPDEGQIFKTVTTNYVAIKPNSATALTPSNVFKSQSTSSWSKFDVKAKPLCSDSGFKNPCTKSSSGNLRSDKANHKSETTCDKNKKPHYCPSSKSTIIKETKKPCGLKSSKEVVAKSKVTSKCDETKSKSENLSFGEHLKAPSTIQCTQPLVNKSISAQDKSENEALCQKESSKSVNNESLNSKFKGNKADLPLANCSGEESKNVMTQEQVCNNTCGNISNGKPEDAKDKEAIEKDKASLRFQICPQAEGSSTCVSINVKLCKDGEMQNASNTPSEQTCPPKEISKPKCNELSTKSTTDSNQTPSATCSSGAESKNATTKEQVCSKICGNVYKPKHDEDAKVKEAIEKDKAVLRLQICPDAKGSSSCVSINVKSCQDVHEMRNDSKTSSEQTCPPEEFAKPKCSKISTNTVTDSNQTSESKQSTKSHPKCGDQSEKKSRNKLCAKNEKISQDVSSVRKNPKKHCKSFTKSQTSGQNKQSTADQPKCGDLIAKKSNDSFCDNQENTLHNVSTVGVEPKADCNKNNALKQSTAGKPTCEDVVEKKENLCQRESQTSGPNKQSAADQPKCGDLIENKSNDSFCDIQENTSHNVSTVCVEPKADCNKNTALKQSTAGKPTCKDLFEKKQNLCQRDGKPDPKQVSPCMKKSGQCQDDGSHPDPSEDTTLPNLPDPICKTKPLLQSDTKAKEKEVIEKCKANLKEQICPKAEGTSICVSNNVKSCKDVQKRNASDKSLEQTTCPPNEFAKPKCNELSTNVIQDSNPTSESKLPTDKRPKCGDLVSSNVSSVCGNPKTDCYKSSTNKSTDCGLKSGSKQSTVKPKCGDLIENQQNDSFCDTKNNTSDNLPKVCVEPKADCNKKTALSTEVKQLCGELVEKKENRSERIGKFDPRLVGTCMKTSAVLCQDDGSHPDPSEDTTLPNLPDPICKTKPILQVNGSRTDPNHNQKPQLKPVPLKDTALAKDVQIANDNLISKLHNKLFCSKENKIHGQIKTPAGRRNCFSPECSLKNRPKPAVNSNKS